jgi:DNA polymerase-3 subunit gamma/tau
VGQDYIKSILSRAAAENKIAPAYLFSGTRGVGKTTVARIFAKAINCEQGPASEPCNECGHCVQITKGVATDVMEIDGASHTGVDNVRKLREEVAYAPLSCRYKVVIIDEAHMLSKSAFNALLKTLEEPPKHCVFIMATTEPEKFPITIISRCQHYVFKRIPQNELSSHLQSVLEAEKLDYEPQALALIARRGAGSVRDSMSLLAQVLALGEEKLTAKDVRNVLGLAGQDFFFQAIEAIYNQDLALLHQIVEDLQNQGLDMGFFLREFALCWRNLFLLAKAGQQAKHIIELPEEETDAWLEWARRFPLSRIHASWQMVLEGQKNVLKSLEPGLALELLLLNLAYLPELLPVARGELNGALNSKGDVRQAVSRHGISRPIPSQASASGARHAQSVPAGSGKDMRGPGCAQQPSDNLAVSSAKVPKESGIRQDTKKKTLNFRNEGSGSEKRLAVSELKEKVKQHPVVQKVMNEFNARVVDIRFKGNN